MVRLDRGGTEFLIAVAKQLITEVGADWVYSPALYAGSTRVWRRSGFDDYETLDVMERLLNGKPAATTPPEVWFETDPDWGEILDVDRSAFEGFWGMSSLGLREAYRTNRSTALPVVTDGDRILGYALVGSQWGTVYLHRIAVRPDESGRGLGAALLKASIDWGHRSGGRSMVLNVRPENRRAKRLYENLGFTDTGTKLRVLRYRRP